MNFKLTHIPKRPSRPRDKGLTMAMDKGLSLNQVESLLSATGDLIDMVKLGFGTAYVTPNLQEKIRLYQSSGMRVYLGGTLFEAFVARKRFKDYRKLIDDLGLDMAEVSDGSISIDHDEKLDFIHKLKEQVTVLSEVGSKEAGILVSPAKWVRMMQTELEAGSWKVIAEARESGNVGIYRPNGRAHSALVNRIISKVALDDILWEAPQKPQQVWFIQQFGSNVNLGNIAPEEVIPLETLRLGLRGDTFFQFLPDNIAEPLKQEVPEKAKVKK